MKGKVVDQKLLQVDNNQQKQRSVKHKGNKVRERGETEKNVVGNKGRRDRKTDTE